MKELTVSEAGRKGGKSKSPAKVKASKENGRAGGRVGLTPYQRLLRGSPPAPRKGRTKVADIVTLECGDLPGYHRINAGKTRCRCRALSGVGAWGAGRWQRKKRDG